MLCFARSSPKLFRLSSAPRALTLTLIPGADFCWARAIKAPSLLGSGLNRIEFRNAAVIAKTASKITAATSLYGRERFIACQLREKRTLHRALFEHLVGDGAQLSTRLPRLDDTKISVIGGKCGADR